MTASQILWALAGFIICALIMTIVGFLIACLLWYLIRNDLDFDDITYMEEYDDE